MSRIGFSLAISLVPAIAAAQARTQVSASTSADARVEAHGRDSSSHRIPASYSTQSRTQLEITLTRADSERLPRRAIEDRIAEGQAKGASEAQVVAQSGKMLAHLEASHAALVKAGRSHPSDEETTRGAEVLARGYTSVQLETVAKSASPDRGLSAALETLVALRARGEATDRAVVAVTSNLAKNASDETIASLAGSASANANSNAAVGTTGGHGSAATGVAGSVGANASGAAGSVGAGAGAAAGAAGHLGGVAGSATGAVSGVVRKP